MIRRLTRLANNYTDYNGVYIRTTKKPVSKQTMKYYDVNNEYKQPSMLQYIYDKVYSK